jgi:hypothetical protein
MIDVSLPTLLRIFFVLGTVFALAKGGPAERIAAAIAIGNLLIGRVGEWLAPDSESIIRLVNDGLAALMLLAVTLRFGAPWMGGVMFFFAAQFTLHSYYLVTERPATDYLHAVINNVNWCGIVWCLIIGAAVAWRARARAASASAA